MRRQQRTVEVEAVKDEREPHRSDPQGRLAWTTPGVVLHAIIANRQQLLVVGDLPLALGTGGVDLSD